MKSLPSAFPRRLFATLAFVFAWPGFAPAQQTPATPAPARTAPVLPEGVRVVRDLAYVENGHAQQKLDLYLPAQPKGPLLVWIHGGGWRGGTKNNPPGLAMVNEGVTVASVEYRFSQHAIFPAQIEDCKAAIRWLRAYATEYGYDPKKVAVWGASAGGHLVALLGVTGQTREFDMGAHLNESSAVQCVINWFGPADLPAYEDMPLNPIAQRENPQGILAQLLGGPLSEKLALAGRASPVSWVTKDAAPMLIMHGTDDPLVPIEQSQVLAKRYQAAGAEVVLDVIGGAAHGGAAFSTPEKLGLINNFLARHWAK